MERADLQLAEFATFAANSVSSQQVSLVVSCID